MKYFSSQWGLMIGYDHYKEARSIADQIQVEGFPDEAANVRAAIEDGRSGTEIFMQLRFYLPPIQEEVRVDSQPHGDLCFLAGLEDSKSTHPSASASSFQSDAL